MNCPTRNVDLLGFGDSGQSPKLLQTCSCTTIVYCGVAYTEHISAWREAVSCKARLAGNGMPFPSDATRQMEVSRHARRETQKLPNPALQPLIHHHPMANKVIRRHKSRAHTAANSKSTIDPFSQEERTALINAAHGQLKNLIQSGFWTGLRLSELLFSRPAGTSARDSMTRDSIPCFLHCRYSGKVHSCNTQAGYIDYTLAKAK